MSFKNFKTNNGERVRVVLMSGHATWVGPEFAPLHERFHSAAYSAGCVSEDMVRNKAMSSIPTKKAEEIVNKASLDEKILKAIDELVKENNTEAFSKSGIPDARILSTMVGERVTSHKRDELWYKYQEQDA